MRTKCDPPFLRAEWNWCVGKKAWKRGGGGRIIRPAEATDNAGNDIFYFFPSVSLAPSFRQMEEEQTDWDDKNMKDLTGTRVLRRRVFPPRDPGSFPFLDFVSPTPLLPIPILKSVWLDQRMSNWEGHNKKPLSNLCTISRRLFLCTQPWGKSRKNASKVFAMESRVKRLPATFAKWVGGGPLIKTLSYLLCVGELSSAPRWKGRLIAGMSEVYKTRGWCNRWMYSYTTILVLLGTNAFFSFFCKLGMIWKAIDEFRLILWLRWCPLLTRRCL